MDNSREYIEAACVKGAAFGQLFLDYGDASIEERTAFINQLTMDDKLCFLYIISLINSDALVTLLLLVNDLGNILKQLNIDLISSMV